MYACVEPSSFIPNMKLKAFFCKPSIPVSLRSAVNDPQVEGSSVDSPKLSQKVGLMLYRALSTVLPNAMPVAIAPRPCATEPSIPLIVPVLVPLVYLVTPGSTSTLPC